MQINQNIAVAQEATNETVFTITDTSILDQIESLFLNNDTVNVQWVASVLSNEGVVGFDIEISIEITATLI